jgi:hypothetical protein
MSVRPPGRQRRVVDSHRQAGSRCRGRCRRGGAGCARRGGPWAEWPSQQRDRCRRRRGCLRRTRRRKTIRPAMHQRRHAWIAVPHPGSAHASAFPLRHRGSLIHPSSTWPRRPAHRHPHHGGHPSSVRRRQGRPVPARFCRRHTRRSIISSQRGGQCPPASAADTRGGASSHHSGEASVRPLPPPKIRPLRRSMHGWSGRQDKYKHCYNVGRAVSFSEGTTCHWGGQQHRRRGHESNLSQRLHRGH